VGAAVAVVQADGLVLALVLALASTPLGDLYHDDRLTSCLLALSVATLVTASRSTPVALLERRLAYRWIAAAEVLDNIAFLPVALPVLYLGGGFDALVVALAVRNIPAAVLLRWR